MANYLTFAEIVSEIKGVIKTSGTSKDTLIKNVINMVYLNEVIPVDTLYPLFNLMILDESKKAKAPATITGLTQADPGVVTAVAHGFEVGDIVSLYDVVGMTEVNERTFKVSVVGSADTFEIQTLEGDDVDTSGFTAYTSGGTVHHRGIQGSDIKRILSFAWKDSSIPVIRLPSQDIDQNTSYWGDSTSRPEYYLFKQYYAGTAEVDQLIWFHAADKAYHARIWYEKKVARLSADADVPQLPWRFHDTLVSGAAARLIESKAQTAASFWPSIYKSQLVALKAYNRSLFETDLSKPQPFML